MNCDYVLIVFLFWCFFFLHWEKEMKHRGKREDPSPERWPKVRVLSRVFIFSVMKFHLCPDGSHSWTVTSQQRSKRSLKSILEPEEKLWTGSFILVLRPGSLFFFPLWLNATLLLKRTGSDLGDLWLPHHVTFSSLAALSSLKLPARTKPMEGKKAETHVHETV